MNRIILPFLIVFGGFLHAQANELQLIGVYENPGIYYGTCRGNDINKYLPTFFGQPINKNSTLSISTTGNNSLIISLNTTGYKALKIALVDQNIVSWTNSWSPEVHNAFLVKDNGSTNALLKFSLANVSDGSYGGGFWFFQDTNDLSISLTIAMDNWCELSWARKK